MRTLPALLVCGYVVTCLGCAMCDSSQDCKYAAYGGVVERLDMVNGRVNSVFNPASVSQMETNAQSSEQAAQQPTPAPAQPENTPEDEGLENGAEDRTDSSPLDRLRQIPRSSDNVQEQLENLDVPPGDGELQIPESDGETPNLDDLFDDMQDET